MKPVASVRRLALRLALRRADGTLQQLPRFTVADHPEQVRAHLLAFYAMRDEARKMRGELAGQPRALRDRMRLALVVDELDRAIEAARDCLRRIARRGGRGTAAAGAGRSPAVMAQGCAALASSGGTRAKAPAASADPAAADLLFSRPAGQELPRPGSLNHAQHQPGGHSHG